MGGYAVPDSVVDTIVEKLNVIKAEFYEKLAIFIADFERNKDAWIKDNTEFAHIIRDQVPDKETVEKSFEFTFTLYKINPLEGFEPDENEVANQVLHEIGLTCKEMSDRMLDRKRSISGKNLYEQLDPLIKKLDTLSFGNGRLLKVVNEFFALQKSIPMELIDQDHPTFGHVLTFLSMCADTNKLEKLIDGSFSVTKLINGIQRASSSVSSGGSAPVLPQSTQSTLFSPSTSGAYF